MKIGIISTYPPYKCGIAVACTEKIVKEYEKEGHSVTVYSFKGYDYQANFVKPILDNRNPLSYIRAASLISQARFDRLWIEYEYTFYNRLFFPFFLAMLRLHGVKTNLRMHTIVPYTDLLKGGLFKLYPSFMFLFVSRVFLQTEIARSKLLKLSFVRPAISVIPLPIPLAAAKFGRHTIPHKGINLLLFGFITSDKGIDIAIKAFGGVGRIFLNIVGSVNPRSMKKQFLYFDGIKRDVAGYRNITLVDRFVSEEEKLAFFAQADFILLPYRFIEQSAVLTEIWAMGKIPVSSDIPPLKEALDGGRYGVLFKAEDKDDLRAQVLSIAADKKRQEALLENIRSLVKERAFVKTVKKYLDEMA